MDQYTHDFIYRLGDGGKYLKGEAEFNKDKKVSYRIQTWSEPMPHDLLNAFSEFIDRVKMRYDQWDGIKLVEIREKGFQEPV